MTLKLNLPCKTLQMRKYKVIGMTNIKTRGLIFFLTNVNANYQKHQIVENILKKHEKEKKEPIIIQL